MLTHNICQGIKLEEYAKNQNYKFDDKIKSKIHKNVINAAYEVINKKGATNYAIASAVNRIVKAILGNEKSVLPISTLLDGYYGINDIYLSVPTIVGRNGSEKTLKVLLQENEIKELKVSANTLKKVLEDSLPKDTRKIV